MKHWCRKTLLLLGAATSMSFVWAGRDFTPLSGTWVIDAELDGKPGRGLAIDVQGDTVVLQVYGYEASGEATFYMASGPMVGNGAVLPLQKFQGGTALGGPVRDAELAANVGEVQLQFANGVQGSIQLPGEPAYAMRRFVFNGQGDLSVPNPSQRFALAELGSENQPLNLWFMDVVPTGLLTLRRPYPSAEWNLQCQPANDQGTVECIAEASQSTPRIRLSYQQFLYDASALLDVDGEPERRLVGAYMRTRTPAGIPTSGDRNWYSALQGFDAEQRLPEPGTWIMRDEKTGKPGRGISLDVQFGQALMQVFHYRPDGTATFHMGSGEFSQSRANIALKTYQGGRYLGGPWQSATEASDAGVAAINFDRLDSRKDMNEGSIRLPGEPLRVMERFEMQPMRPALSSLMGDWVFSHSLSSKPKVVALNVVKGHVLANAAGDFECRFTPLLTDTVVDCSSTAGDGAQPERFSFPFSFQGRSAIRNSSYGIAFRVRDRLGNLTGVGPLVRP